MPRTKEVGKSRANRGNTDESDSVMRDFDRLASQRIHKMEADIQMQINGFANSVDLTLSRLPTEIRKMTLGELLAAEIPESNETNMASEANSQPAPAAKSNIKDKKKTKRVTAASDDGYATECTTRTTHVSRINTTRSSSTREARNARSSSSNRQSGNRTRNARSSSSSRLTNNEKVNRKDLLKVNSGPPKTASKFKTPSAKNSAPYFNAVTPKVKPNTPMNILRRPRDGEMVLSMQGSPLLVSSIVQERTANINVPLTDGNVISLLPNAGLRLSHVPDLDHETMQQLKTLKEHIDMVIGSK